MILYTESCLFICKPCGRSGAACYLALLGEVIQTIFESAIRCGSNIVGSRFRSNGPLYAGEVSDQGRAATISLSCCQNRMTKEIALSPVYFQVAENISGICIFDKFGDRG